MKLSCHIYVTVVYLSISDNDCNVGEVYIDRPVITLKWIVFGVLFTRLGVV
jgi:hypothetical protein